LFPEDDVSKPRLLDLFCCEGGAALGYARAGFDVVGVDIEPRFAKRYPFEFHRGDAIEYLKAHGHEFDAIHASPPCQGYSVATLGTPGAREKHPRLIEPVRDALVASGRPWVIENVVGAPLLSPLMLCGSMFDLTATDDDGRTLRLERHRLFESNVMLYPPGPDRHDRSVPVGGVYGGGRSDRWEAKHVRRGGYTPAKHVREALIGVERGHMTLHGLSQSIPPAYTEWIGAQLLDHLAAKDTP
jgi:DNA (cytosine-5)-methyltransferase 1